MKKLIVLLALASWSAYALGPIITSVALPLGIITVPPSTPTSINLVVRGCDTVFASVNGGPSTQLMPPYTVSFTSAGGGPNTITVIYCNDRGQKATNNLVVTSTELVRLYPRRLFR